jgi:CheY-like chemotaxis protein
LCGQSFAIPLDYIERIRHAPEAKMTCSGGDKLLQIGQELFPWLPLQHVLGMPAEGSVRHDLLILKVANRRMAMQVDQVLQQQDVVVKPMGQAFVPAELFAGATVNGEGRVVLILNLPGIVDGLGSGSVRLESDKPRPPAQRVAPVRPSPRVLVVDDSISVRKQLANSLAKLGCEVKVAADGLEALEQLRLARFDMICTDLEMPRMHGFEFLEELRNKPAWSEVPVMVVTSCAAQKDRQRALALGCDAYLVKPFSSEELTTETRRLLAIKVQAA